MNFNIVGINHIGLAPKDPQQTKLFFSEALGLPFKGKEEVKDQKVNTLMFSSDHNKKASNLEILVPTDEASVIQKFLDKRGSGIHHVALTVDNINNAIEHLESKGINMIDSAPRTGAHNTLVAFVHPRSTGGILVELVQEQ